MECPKREWRGVDLLNPIARVCGILPMSSSDSGGGRGGGGGGRTGTTWVGFDTDVNAPSLAEFQHRTHTSRQSRSRFVDDGMGREVEKQLTSLSYVTVGTGVGVGLIMNSMLVHGLLNLEGGHVTIRPLNGDDYTGYAWGAEWSPYGGKFTVEGTMSSVALTERYYRTMVTEGDGDGSNVVANAQSREVLSTLPNDHPLWDHASNVIANLCVTILLLTSCQRIVLGGGVMKRNSLYRRVRSRVWTILNRYFDSVHELSNEGKLDDIIVGGSWGDVGSGIVGAYALALDAYEDGIDGTVDGRRKLGDATGGKEVGSTGASRDDGRDEIVAHDDNECRSSFAMGVLTNFQPVISRWRSCDIFLTMVKTVGRRSTSTREM
jgi:hypothetical protein